jgi:hypothetical protein
MSVRTALKAYELSRVRIAAEKGGGDIAKERVRVICGVYDLPADWTGLGLLVAGHWQTGDTQNASFAAATEAYYSLLTTRAAPCTDETLLAFVCEHRSSATKDGTEEKWEDRAINHADCITDPDSASLVRTYVYFGRLDRGRESFGPTAYLGALQDLRLLGAYNTPWRFVALQKRIEAGEIWALPTPWRTHRETCALAIVRSASAEDCAFNEYYLGQVWAAVA